MRGVYCVTGQVASGAFDSTDQNIFTIKAASTHIIELISVKITSDTGSNTMMHIQMHRATSDATGTSAPTPAKMENGDQASGATCAMGKMSGEPSTGTICAENAQNALSGWMQDFLREERRYIPPSGRMSWKWKGAAPALQINFELVFREIG